MDSSDGFSETDSRSKVGVMDFFNLCDRDKERHWVHFDREKQNKYWYRECLCTVHTCSRDPSVVHSSCRAPRGIQMMEMRETNQPTTSAHSGYVYDLPYRAGVYWTILEIRIPCRERQNINIHPEQSIISHLTLQICTWKSDPKNENSVINYSPSCRSNPIRPVYLWNTN